MPADPAAAQAAVAAALANVEPGSAPTSRSPRSTRRIPTLGGPRRRGDLAARRRRRPRTSSPSSCQHQGHARRAARLSAVRQPEGLRRSCGRRGTRSRCRSTCSARRSAPRSRKQPAALGSDASCSRAPAGPTEGDIAAEYFGISVDPRPPIDEKRLILVGGHDGGRPAGVWGETGNAAGCTTLSNVKTFLAEDAASSTRSCSRCWTCRSSTRPATS